MLNRLSTSFASAALLGGFGVLVLQVVGGYGAAPTIDYESPSRFLFPTFVGLWALHVLGYYLGDKIRSGVVSSVLYVIGQLGLVVGLTIVSGRAIAVLVLFVVWGAQAVVVFPKRWPVVVIAGGTVALIAMSRNPTATQEIITIVTILSLIVMTTYLVSHVRGVLVRREAKELLDELSSTQSELHGYATQVEEVALLNERQRMARELHDTLAQGLVGVTLQLEAADSQLEKGGARRAREIVGEAMARARETLASARSAIHDLRENQDDQGIEYIIRREVSRFSAATGIACDIDVDLQDEPSSNVQALVKNVVTEALTNIARHSRAKNARVAVRSDANALSVVVSDDGVGFEAASASRNGHYGLVGLTERARQLDATVQVVTEPGKGTEITLMRQVSHPNGKPGSASDA